MAKDLRLTVNPDGSGIHRDSAIPMRRTLLAGSSAPGAPALHENLRPVRFCVAPRYVKLAIAAQRNLNGCRTEPAFSSTSTRHKLEVASPAFLSDREASLTFESIVRSRRICDAVRLGPLGPYIDGFIEDAATVGYTQSSLSDLVRGVSQFARYLTRMGIADVKQIGDDHVRSFIATLPVSRCGKKYSMPAVRGSRAARRLLRYLRKAGVVAAESRTSPAYTWILEVWLTFLRQHRRLAEGSVDVYRRHAEPFLQALGRTAEPDGFTSLYRAALRPMYIHSSTGRLS